MNGEPKIVKRGCLQLNAFCAQCISYLMNACSQSGELFVQYSTFLLDWQNFKVIRSFVNEMRLFLCEINSLKLRGIIDAEAPGRFIAFCLMSS